MRRSGPTAANVAIWHINVLHMQLDGRLSIGAQHPQKLRIADLDRLDGNCSRLVQLLPNTEWLQSYILPSWLAQGLATKRLFNGCGFQGRQAESINPVA